MNPEDYQKVKAVFQSVLEIEPPKRADFLDNLCQDDADLRLEVEKLLNNYESGFMEETAIQNVADLIVNEESLTSGEKIGRFEIISRLGKGGMGEVYLAHDKSLNRDVAIKVLLPEFSSDKERVNRFKLEAKAASALNHPNIITIHEVGEDNGKLFIATEHIIGETLRSLIEHKGLTLGSSIKIAEQIASALTSAHKAGIIHRDIKPENIMVREDGFVKVLDFGLAKPTITNPEAETMDLVETKKGMIMGSVGYMSPEQARGKEVDARTDLWSVGVVFYEMLKSKTPFQGDTMTDILANIIHKEPSPISEQLPNNPTELYRIVKKSLRKNADERYQTAKDLSLDLKNLRREMELEHELELSVSPERLQAIRSKSNDIQKTVDEDKATKILSNPIITETSVEIARVKSRYRTATLATIGILLIGTFAYFGYGYLKPKRLVDTAFKNTTVEKLPLKGKIGSVIISSDGKYLAYVNGEDGNNGKLILRQMETNTEKEVFDIKDGTLILEKFSPDNNYIYLFYAVKDENYTRLHRISLLGGEMTEIPAPTDSDVSITPDGKRLLFVKYSSDKQKDEIVISDMKGENQAVLYSTTDLWVTSPKMSPDGSKILIFYGNRKNEKVGGRAKLGWIPANGGEITRIGNNVWNIISYGWAFGEYDWLSDSSGVVLTHNLEAEDSSQVFSVNVATGEVTKVTKEVGNHRNVSITADSKALVTMKRFVTSGIWEFDLLTKNSKQISDSSSLQMKYLIATTNENKILFIQNDGKENRNLWQINANGTDEKIVISPKDDIVSPIVSSDGKYVFFITKSEGNSQSLSTTLLWQANIDGTNLQQFTLPEGKDYILMGILPDNNDLLLFEGGFERFSEKFRKYNILSNQISPIIEDSNSQARSLALSSDGKKILYQTGDYPTEEQPNPKITYKLASFDGSKIGETELTLPKDSYTWKPKFASENKSIFYLDLINRSDVWQFDFATQKSTKITNFNLDSIYNFTVSLDGKKLYIVRGNTTDEVVLIKNVE